MGGLRGWSAVYYHIFEGICEEILGNLEKEGRDRVVGLEKEFGGIFIDLFH